MNTPNKLTVLRILLVPLFMVLLLVPFPFHMLAAAVCFAVASVTDLVDGKIARARGQVTNFGKFLDPLADKMLVAAALVCFVELGRCSAWVAVIIIAREFLVTSLRLVASGTGAVIAANLWGKAKTATQMTAILFVMLVDAFLPNVPLLFWAGQGLLWLAAALTVVSGAQMLWQNRAYIDTTR